MWFSSVLRFGFWHTELTLAFEGLPTGLSWYCDWQSTLCRWSPRASLKVIKTKQSTAVCKLDSRFFHDPAREAAHWSNIHKHIETCNNWYALRRGKKKKEMYLPIYFDIYSFKRQILAYLGFIYCTLYCIHFVILCIVSESILTQLAGRKTWELTEGNVNSPQPGGSGPRGSFSADIMDAWKRGTHTYTSI